MIIKSSYKRYEVCIKNDFSFINDLKKIKNSFFVIDSKLYRLYKNLFDGVKNIKIIDAKEENKIIDEALKIYDELIMLPSKRNTTLISVGGGIIQDLTGFVSSTLYRGIHWIFIPTTLLAACDSCIGGKTSLNYKKYKNLLGTFYPPDKILICPNFFNTLSEKDFRSGMGEVLKFNIMVGNEGLIFAQKNITKLLNRTPKIIKIAIINSLKFKKKYIEIDEFDRGERIKLNFAHTFGHSLEVISNYVIPHGTAVAIGMIMANYISTNRGYIDKRISTLIESLLMKIINVDIKLIDKPISRYLEIIKKDKKQCSNSISAVLITSFKAKCDLEVKNDINENEIEFAVKYFLEKYRD